MKKFACLILVLSSLLCCSKQKELSFFDKVEGFKISECKMNCSIDSVGVRQNEIKQGDLFVKFGYFLNCSWEDGFIKDIAERNDTLIIYMDRPHNIDTVSVDSMIVDSKLVINEEITKTYEITDCGCFFFFDLKINDVAEAPKVIRVSGEAERTDYLDQLKQNKPPFVESEGVFDLNKPPVSVKRLVLNTKLYDVTSGITDAKHLDDFCKYRNFHLQRHYTIIPKEGYEVRSDLKVYVIDDRFKMSRNKAKELFQSIDIKNPSIKAWSTFYVGMPLDKMMSYLSAEEYHNDDGKVVVLSKKFKSEFYHEDAEVTRIIIQRICDD
jgi:hypothetical protein